MDNSNRNLTSVDPIEALLRAEKATASPLELDRIKLRAISQAENPGPSRYATTKGHLMKSRLALTLLLVVGFMFSTTGATLAISGSSGSGSAAGTQYVPHGGGGPSNESGTKNNTLKPSPSETGGTKGTHAVEGAGAESEAAPTAVEQVAVASTSNSLPFTGFLAIPLLAIGVGMVLLGGVIAVKSRRRPAAGH